MDINNTIADIVIGMPFPFTIGRKQLAIYPVTFAKSLLLARYIKSLGVDMQLLGDDINIEALRLAHEKHEEVAAILAIYATPNTKRDLFDEHKKAIRRNILAGASDEDLATLLIYVLTLDKTEEAMKHLGIDKERKRLSKALSVKKGSDTTMSFGGVSVFGSFIGALKDMGYSDDEIIFELSYSYLRMMLADKITTVYLTDEERNKMPSDASGALVDAEAPGAVNKLNEFLATRGMNRVNMK